MKKKQAVPGSGVELFAHYFCTVTLCLLFLLLFFQDSLMKTIPKITYLDDAIGFLGWLFFLLGSGWELGRKGSWKGSRMEFSISLLLVLLSILGYLSNFFSGISRSFTDIGIDFLHLIKFWGAYYFADFLSSYTRQKDLQKALGKLCRLLILAMTAGFVLEGVFQIQLGLFDVDEYRFHLRAYQFVFSNSGSFSNFCIMLLFTELCMEEGKKDGRFGGYVWICLFMLAATLRFKALGVIAAFLVLTIGQRKGKNIRRYQIVLAVTGAAAVGYSQLRNYFFTGITPRRLLMQYGFITANRFFPLGAGFGTYGTNVAANHYSPLYRQYGFNRYWSLQEGGLYLNDNFWPAIVAQFGYIGLILYGILFWKVYEMIRIRTVPGSKRRLAGCLLLINILIASLGGPIMLGVFAVGFFFLIGIYLPQKGK